MSLLDEYEAIINLKVEHKSPNESTLCVFIPTQSCDLHRFPVYLEIQDYQKAKEVFLNYLVISDHQKDSLGNLFSLLSVSIVVNKDDKEISHPLINTRIYTDDPKQSPDLINEAKKLWDLAFFDAIKNTNLSASISNRDLQPSALIQNSLEAQLVPYKRKKIPYNSNSIFKIVGLSLVPFLSIATIYLYLKQPTTATGLNITNQQALKSLQTPQEYVQDQEQMLDQAFKDMGIDRSQLNNDLSCFTE